MHSNLTAGSSSFTTLELFLVIGSLMDSMAKANEFKDERQSWLALMQFAVAGDVEIEKSRERSGSITSSSPICMYMDSNAI